jgi:hypothetical protein
MNETAQFYMLTILTFLFVGEAARWGRAALSAYRVWQIRRSPEYKALEAAMKQFYAPPANDNVVRIDNGFLQMPPRGRQ